MFMEFGTTWPQIPLTSRYGTNGVIFHRNANREIMNMVHVNITGKLKDTTKEIFDGEVRVKNSFYKYILLQFLSYLQTFPVVLLNLLCQSTFNVSIK